MYIRQVQTSACETIYEIERDGETCRLHLWVISGGTPALAFADYKGGTKRFTVLPSVLQRWTGYCTVKGCFPHQDPDHIQGPTFNELLPNGTEDLLAFLDEYGQKRAQAIAEEQERERLKALGLPSRDKWPKREPEPEPRLLPGCQRSDGGWVVQGRDIVKALKGTKGAISFGGVILNPSLLRQYASVLKNDWLVVYPANGDGKLHIRTADSRNRATIQHGAWDKYHGLNGFNARLVLADNTIEVQVPLALKANKLRKNIQRRSKS